MTEKMGMFKNIQPSWSPVSARRYYFVVITLMASCIVIFSQYWLNASDDHQIYYSLFKNVINDDNCQVPRIDPHDSSILKYISPVNPLECKKLQPELTRLVNNRLIFNFEVFRAEGLDKRKVTCQYRCFSRRDGDDITVDFTDYVDFVNETEIFCEFVEVVCRSGYPSIPIYRNHHAQVIVDPEITVDGPKSHPQPNVILFVLDSVSQSNWKRNLPLTLDVLEQDYGSTIFEGFTKVGDNSFPNAVAFLAGVRAMTVGYEDELQPVDGYFDSWPLIWNDFKALNYSTFYAEDYPDFNLFSYLNNGFQKKPTDHHFRPFWLQVYGSFLHRRSTHLCYGNNKMHNLQLDYLKDFVVKYSKKKKPVFALNWLTELGHDWLNQVNIGDHDVSSFLKEMRTHLKDSFVFVFSDHGHRFDPIRQSVIGRIEERMPFFSMALPQFLRGNKKLMATVKQNSKKLTSFWDVYVTLRDIYQLTKERNFDSFDPEKEFVDFEKRSIRGSSLLRKLPERRNCESAGIPEDFCICQRESQVSTNDSHVVHSAAAIMARVNGILEIQIAANTCAHLDLDEIVNAQTFLPNIKIATDSYGFYVMYRVSVTAKPSGAFFEGTVKHLIKSEEYSVVGDINRINKYGNQSACMDTQQLRKYCYCIV